MKSRFDEAKADRATKFFESLLVHTKGRWAREPFQLAEFQREEIIRPLFGDLVQDPDSGLWVRRYTLAWIELGRGNGKSELMAGIALLLTGGDDEESAEIYGVARDIDQASLVFNVARRMVELSPVLSKYFRVYPRYREIVYPKTASRYRVVPGDALGNLGQDPHGILFDEIIAQPSGDLWDAMKTGFKRLQPLMVAATTAGDDPGSFAKAEHDFSLRVMEDPKLAPRRLVYIRSAPKEDDPGNEATWAKANPALGAFLRPQILRDEWTEAQENPRAMRAFSQFRLNQWLDTPSIAWVGLDDWDATAQMVDADQMTGRKAFGGLVAGSVTDLTALCWTFPPDRDDDRWRVIWRHFLPEENLPDLISRTEGKAEQWAKEGRLTLTEGDQIDVAKHVEIIEADLKLFNVKELAHDTHGIIGIVQQVMAAHPQVPVGIAPNTPGTALLDWERLILAQTYHHGGDPVVRWQVGHTMVKESVSGVLRIDRKGSVENVSAVYAAELALRRGLADTSRPSVYETRGVRTI